MQMSEHSLSTALVLLLLAVSTAQQTSSSGCPATCLNGGTCLQVYNSDSYYCDCDGTGFTGSTCQTATTNASSSPPSLLAVAASTPAPVPTAVNSSASSETTTSGCPAACQNGVCQQEYNSEAYYCECSSGFSGPACNVSSAVAPATPASTAGCPVACEHGQCTQEYNSNVYHCQCNSGYSGASCSNATAAPTPSQAPPPPPPESHSGCPVACINGQCKQVYNSNDYTCQCTNGWTGLSCDTVAVSAAPAPVTAKEATSSGSASHGTGTSIPGWAVFLIVLAIIAGLIGIGAIGIVTWQRRRRTTFVKFNDATFEPQNVEVLTHNKSKQQPPLGEQQA